MSTTEEKTLEQREAELLAIINTPSEKERAARELVEVQAQRAEQNAAEAKAAAATKLTSIKRAYGSVRDEYDEDEARVRQCLKALNAAIATWNARYERLTGYEEQARQLNKAYLLELPEFADLKSPERVTPPRFALRDLAVEPLLDKPRVHFVAEDPQQLQPPSRPRPKMSEREQRQARAMAQEVKDTQRALRTIPGRV